MERIPNVLIIDDDELFCKTLSGAVRHAGYNPTYALDLEKGLEEALSGIYDVVFLDVRMPDGDGLDILPRIKQARSSPEVIIITGHGDPDGAELAIASGAWDYVGKPSSLDAMTLPLIRALQYRREKMAAKPRTGIKRRGIIGSGPRVEAALAIVAQAAPSDANVLITGETGVGKELFARAIHENSPRADRKFIVVDCAALPKTLVEDILFGHEKGAFTGAHRSRDGMIRQAHGGTMFLDEIGDLPLSLQKSFLRVLQEHRFRPLGGTREIESDFRLVAATNRDLDLMMQKGQFREDLLFRLRAFTLALPPLRERPEDISELASHFVSELCRRYSVEEKQVSPEFFETLKAYNWPGNIRELINVMETTIAAARSETTLFATHLPTHIRIHAARSSVNSSRQDSPSLIRHPSAAEPSSIVTFKEFRKRIVEESEKAYLKDLFSAARGDIREACRLSGLSKSRIYELLKKHGQMPLGGDKRLTTVEKESRS